MDFIHYYKVTLTGYCQFEALLPKKQALHGNNAANMN